MNSTINVAVVEDHDEYREHLAALIGGANGFSCTGAYSTAERALKNLSVQKPHVVLLDLELPSMPGVEFIHRVKARLPAIDILVLTIHDEPKLIFEALESGATGYLIKPVSPSKIIEAITDVHNEGSPMSSQVARLVIKAFHKRGRSNQELESLTRREAEILALLAKGHRYQEIAGELGVSVRTVGTHLHNIYEKLHVRCRGEAAAKYLGRAQTSK